MGKLENIGLYIESYEPSPRDRKSFYGKAIVERFTDGFILKSYNTEVLAYKKSTGEYYRLWQDWSATTGRHIASVSGLNKAEFCKLAIARHEGNGDLIIKEEAEA